MLKSLLAIFLVPFLFAAAEINQPLSVLIIGGGPTGLASAIEAVNSGCNVTIVEKREEYSRSQPIALWSSSLKLLRKWNVIVPEMQLSNFSINEEKFAGILRIKSLEKSLAKRCEELGIKRVYGEFQNFGVGREACVKTTEEEIIIPYDVLIAADGFHSKIRESLSIQMNYFGSAKGAYMIIPDFSNNRKEGRKAQLIKKGNSFLLLLKPVSLMTFIYIQDPLEASKDQIRNLLENQGWEKEVQSMTQGYISDLVEGISIKLSQAETFCDLERSVVLLGDAVVSGSFLFGDGLNTALSSAEVVGFFIEELSRDRQSAFQKFNESMKELTDKIIERGAVLFNIESLS